MDSKGKVLIVDDVPDNLQILGSILRENNIKIFAAFNGMQALKIANNVLPDLILLDVSMPDMDGFEVCSRLKQSDVTKNIPIIFVTARTETSEVIKGFKLGGVDYVLKPYNSLELMQRVTTHLELKKSRDIIEEQNAQLQALNATKDKFFSIIAHDLKNPFSSIIGFSELLANNYKKYEPEKIGKFSKLIYDTARSGYTLLENLLEWSRSQTGRIKFEPVTLQIDQSINDCTQLLKGSADNKSVSLLLDVANDLFAIADEGMVNTILRNLISNAVKFTPFGGSIIIKAVKDGTMVKISVSDTGVGIKPENLAKLFKIDKNISTKGTNDEKGTGLGLVLCKEFIEKNGGTINVESEVGVGSTFTFTLKAADNESSDCNIESLLNNLMYLEKNTSQLSVDFKQVFLHQLVPLYNNAKLMFTTYGIREFGSKCINIGNQFNNELFVDLGINIERLNNKFQFGLIQQIFKQFETLIRIIDVPEE